MLLQLRGRARLVSDLKSTVSVAHLPTQRSTAWGKGTKITTWRIIQPGYVGYLWRQWHGIRAVPLISGFRADARSMIYAWPKRRRDCSSPVQYCKLQRGVLHDGLEGSYLDLNGQYHPVTNQKLNTWWGDFGSWSIRGGSMTALYGAVIWGVGRKKLESV